MTSTKQLIGRSFMQLVCEKPFDKISVSDITSKCNLNRQTFYYHFQDKYECLEWIYRHDCLSPLIHISLDNWNTCIEEMLMIMQKHAQFYTRTIYASPRSFIDPLFEVTKKLFRKTIHIIDEKDHVNDDEEDFISEFLAQGIVGTITSWVVKGMKQQPHDLSEKLKKMAIDMDHLRNANPVKKDFTS